MKIRNQRMSDRILTLPAAKGGLPDTDPEASLRKTTTLGQGHHWGPRQAGCAARRVRLYVRRDAHPPPRGAPWTRDRTAVCLRDRLGDERDLDARVDSECSMHVGYRVQLYTVQSSGLQLRHVGEDVVVTGGV